jgi:small GTP-binding protein
MAQMKRVGVVFCGEAGVGKTTLIKRFSEGKFTDQTAGTVGGGFFSSYVRRDGQVIALELWDTAGSERYHSVIPSFFRNAAVVVVVFDLTNRRTFEQVSFWQNFAHLHAPVSACFLLVGNKVDLSGARVLGFEEERDYAESHGFMGCVNTSAKTGEGIEMLFGMLSDVPTTESLETEIPDGVILLEDKKCCL